MNQIENIFVNFFRVYFGFPNLSTLTFIVGHIILLNIDFKKNTSSLAVGYGKYKGKYICALFDMS